MALMAQTASAMADASAAVARLVEQYPYGQCMVDAGQAYGVSPLLIDAIIRAESAHDPLAVHRNSDGSEDVGLMQINQFWFPHIAPMGYDRASLFNPCISIWVGTWVLAQEIQRFGYTWSAVGAYNAGPAPDRSERRAWYAQRVFAQLDR